MPDPNKTPAAPPRKQAELRADPYAGYSGDLSIDNAVRAIGRGAAFGGPYLDELDAGTHAVVAPYIDPLLPDSWIPELPGRTVGERYDNALARQRGADKAFDEQHPYISEGLQRVGEKMSERALRLPPGIMTNIARGAVEGFGAGEGGFRNRAERAVHDAVEEALKGLGMGEINTLGTMPAADAQAGRKAGAKAALTRALLRVRGGNGGGGGGW
ncbi:hypothetical protein R1521_09865 [Rhizobium brockwellii]|uniref:Uncharacterized protein n=1 Tax=Rhizobium brockwellii TaxID=3019932 RepID=A0ABU3YJ34_9HYPH|nr:hypothetical protein [Rhizobium brockwellii]MDV4178809.1 hypothetical protein [Rhizobium brockwellii]MDV4185807.1 hypothetical protein [Rhizobium brockwellii]